MKIFIFVFIFLFGFASSNGFADEEHKHEEKHEHEDEHGDEQAEPEVANSAIGPEKGILEKGEKGFKLSPEAIKTFELGYLDVAGMEFEIPKAALVKIRDEKFVYRFNEDWIERLPVIVLKKSEVGYRLRLAKGEPPLKVVIRGSGFIRAAEIIVEEGVSHGHSH